MELSSESSSFYSGVENEDVVPRISGGLVKPSSENSKEQLPTSTSEPNEATSTEPNFTKTTSFAVQQVTSSSSCTEKAASHPPTIGSRTTSEATIEVREEKPDQSEPSEPEAVNDFRALVTLPSLPNKSRHEPVVVPEEDPEAPNFPTLTAPAERLVLAPAITIEPAQPALSCVGIVAPALLERRRSTLSITVTLPAPVVEDVAANVSAVSFQPPRQEAGCSEPCCFMNVVPVPPVCYAATTQPSSSESSTVLPQDILPFQGIPGFSTLLDQQSILLDSSAPFCSHYFAGAPLTIGEDSCPTFPNPCQSPLRFSTPCALPFGFCDNLQEPLTLPISANVPCLPSFSPQQVLRFEGSDQFLSPVPPPLPAQWLGSDPVTVLRLNPETALPPPYHSGMTSFDFGFPPHQFSSFNSPEVFPSPLAPQQPPFLRDTIPHPLGNGPATRFLPPLGPAPINFPLPLPEPRPLQNTGPPYYVFVNVDTVTVLVGDAALSALLGSAVTSWLAPPRPFMSYSAPDINYFPTSIFAPEVAQNLQSGASMSGCCPDSVPITVTSLNELPLHVLTPAYSSTLDQASPMPSATTVNGRSQSQADTSRNSGATLPRCTNAPISPVVVSRNPSPAKTLSFPQVDALENASIPTSTCCSVPVLLQNSTPCALAPRNFPSKQTARMRDVSTATSTTLREPTVVISDGVINRSPPSLAMPASTLSFCTPDWCSESPKPSTVLRENKVREASLEKPSRPQRIPSTESTSPNAPLPARESSW